jgi:hypothetical protein
MPYLGGWIVPEVSSLEYPIPRISGVCPQYYEVEMKLSEKRMLVVRHHQGKYSSYLRSGYMENELFFDMHMLHFPYKDRTLEKHGTALWKRLRLVDCKVIFSCAQNFMFHCPVHHA